MSDPGREIPVYLGRQDELGSPVRSRWASLRALRTFLFSLGFAGLIAPALLLILGSVVVFPQLLIRAPQGIDTLSGGERLRPRRISQLDATP